ncbi:hypothetical protein DENSPDRAFT_717205 [Dentipellis sp. KUC8613]|nr:hypothetical protein DENSPDRAFT_717205 [Dentipellis sp. KUC8613]
MKNGRSCIPRIRGSLRPPTYTGCIRRPAIPTSASTVVWVYIAGTVCIMYDIVSAATTDQILLTSPPNVSICHRARRPIYY